MKNKTLTIIQCALSVVGLVVSALNMIHTKYERRSIVMFAGMLIMFIVNLINCCSEVCCSEEGEFEDCCCCTPEVEDCCCDCAI